MKSFYVKLALCIATALHILASAASAQSAVDTNRFVTDSIYNWTIYRDRTFVKTQPFYSWVILEILRADLANMYIRMPLRVLKKLSHIPIYIFSYDTPTESLPLAYYHTGFTWGRSPLPWYPDTDTLITGPAIVIPNGERLVEGCRLRPGVLLHELSHAYQHVFSDVITTFNEQWQLAVTSGKYDSVLISNGSYGRAYALTSAEEYFAECSTAYFMTSESYPFVRAELEEFDPVGAKMVHTMWYEPEKIYGEKRVREILGPR